MTVRDWSLVVAERDATPVDTFTAGDLPEDAPAQVFRGQESFEGGVGTIGLPLTSAKLSMFDTPNRFLHVKAGSETLTTFIIGVPDDVVRSESEEVDETATYRLRHLLHLLDEGRVLPAVPFGASPPGYDRLFDSSDPAYDDSAWDDVADYGTLDTLQPDWPLTPFAGGFTSLSSVHVVGPNGSTLGGDPPAPGWYLYRRRVTLADPIRARLRTTGDDAHKFRVDGVEVTPLVVQFGEAATWDGDLSATEHTFWAAVHQSEDPDNPGDGLGPSAFVFQAVPLDLADNEGEPVVVSDSDWKVLYIGDDPPPGFTIGRIAEIVLGQAQALGYMLDVTLAEDIATNDSNGDPWGETWDLTTKAGHTSIGTFFLKELAHLVECKMTALEEGGALWELFPVGGRGSADAFDLSVITGFTIDREDMAASGLVVESHDRLLFREVSPPAGQPKVMGSLTVGSDYDDGQAYRDADAELAKFGRVQEHLAITDHEADGSYWVADSGDGPTDRGMTPGTLRVVSMTMGFDGNGELDLTPEFGDLIVPLGVRSSLALGKLAPGHMGGRSNRARTRSV